MIISIKSVDQQGVTGNVIYSAPSLKTHLDETAQLKDGKWIPVRPVPLSGWHGFKLRIKAAWLVLSNKADAVTW